MTLDNGYFLGHPINMARLNVTLVSAQCACCWYHIVWV